MLLILLTSCYGKKPEKTGMEGKPLPSFTVLLSDSTTRFDTKDIPLDKPVVLFLFGPHCPHSKAQIEEIIANINKLKGIRFYLFTPYPFVQMKQFYKEYQLGNYSNITVGVDMQNFFSQYIGAPGVPFLAIYDKKKLLNKAFLGKTVAKQIKEIAEN